MTTAPLLRLALDLRVRSDMRVTSRGRIWLLAWVVLAGTLEIYQYVGDEMVITWPTDTGRIDARAIACFFAIAARLDREGPAFRRQFGTTPRIRRALHAGPVIAGEVGETKRGIVFHGDVVNTTARLEQIGRELDRPFLVSAEALTRLPGRNQYSLEDLGRQPLRGKVTPVRVYAVSARQ